MPDFHNPAHEEAVRKALDETRVLDGENLDSSFPDDAVHWAAVYAELIGFKERLLDDMSRNLADLPPAAASEVRSVDMEITGQQMNRYKVRRSFWLRRADDLAGERPGASR